MSEAADAKNISEYLLAGGSAAMIARTCVAPVERIKIIFQTNRNLKSYASLVPQIFREEGLLSFWKGNNAAVVRVVPYLSIQLASNEVYRVLYNPFFSDVKMRNFVSGTCAGITAVCITYPLDLVRARLAVLQSSGKAPKVGMFGLMAQLVKSHGVGALYMGCWVTCVGGGLNAGMKLTLYDINKEIMRQVTGAKKDTDLSIWQRALGGAASGMFSQSFCYPIDVIRRRMQTAPPGTKAYSGVISGVITIARNEGITRGLFKGLGLNYLKTVPNVAIYLSLYDLFKYYLQDARHT